MIVSRLGPGPYTCHGLRLPWSGDCCCKWKIDSWGGLARRTWQPFWPNGNVVYRAANKGAGQAIFQAEDVTEATEREGGYAIQSNSFHLTWTPFHTSHPSYAVSAACTLSRTTARTRYQQALSIYATSGHALKLRDAEFSWHLCCTFHRGVTHITWLNLG